MELALKRASLDLTILPRSALSKAVGYALARWPKLTRFAEAAYGHVHIDSNQVENVTPISALCSYAELGITRPVTRRGILRSGASRGREHPRGPSIGPRCLHQGRSVTGRHVVIAAAFGGAHNAKK